jgi:hypothetical protein
MHIDKQLICISRLIKSQISACALHLSTFQAKTLTNMVLQGDKERRKSLVKTNYFRWQELSVSFRQNFTAYEVFQSCNKVKELVSRK